MINKMDLSNKAALLRKKLGVDAASPVDIFHLVQSIDNLTLIFYPLGVNISGVCYKGKKSKAIAINSDMSIGRQRYSLAHELYHLFYDEAENNSVSLVLIGKGDENEKMADQFASYFLVPQISLFEFVQKIKKDRNRNKLTVEDVVKIEQYYGVSHKAMLYRLLDEGEIKNGSLKNMESGIVELAQRLGYDKSLYLPSPENKKKLVLGYYIEKTRELLDKDYISEGKYEELLLSAFRDDMVYGGEIDENVRID